MGTERADEILAERYLRRSGRFLGEDMSDERALVRSIGEPRQRQHEALQPIEEILAKLAAPDLLLQLAVRRAHQPDADLDRRFGARRDHFALLQNVQQSSLERIRQVADLVQEQRAAVGLYDFARLTLTGCGSDPSWTTPEQLVLNLSFGHRRAVDCDERLVGALTCGVQGAREKLLAGSRFAEQQYRNVARQDPFRRFDITRHQRVAEVQFIESAAVRGRGRRLAAQRNVRHAGAPPLGLGAIRDGEEATAVTRLVDRQRVKRLLVAALDQSRQRDVEYALERCVDEVVRALAAELKEGVAVRRDDRAGRVERDDPFAPHADEFRPAVEAHDEGVAEAVEEQTVFDHLRRHVHEHQGVLLRAIRLSGSVQHRNEFTAGIENRRGATSEPGIAGEEVLLAVDDDGRPLEQARPHAVGATVPLAPGRTRQESGARRRAFEARVAIVGEQNAIAIGENDRVT